MAGLVPAIFFDGAGALRGNCTGPELRAKERLFIGGMMRKSNSLPYPGYRPDIDGLRALAILPVVAFHAFPGAVTGGFIGVDVFFVISGFLITSIILSSLEAGRFSFTHFYIRRVKRIFPALLIVLAACLAFGWFTLLADDYRRLGKHIAAGSGFVSNFVLWGEAGYFDTDAATKPLLHLWSLGIEEQFYILWPFVLWLVWRTKSSALTILVLLAIGSFALNLFLVERDSVATFYSPLTRMWELLCGSILAWLLHSEGEWCPPAAADPAAAPARAGWRDGLSIFGLVLLIGGFFGIDSSLSFPGALALVPVAGAVCLILAGHNALVNRVVLSNRLLVWIGLISFPLYLYHWPILTFLRIIDVDPPSAWTRAAAVIAAVILAWATYLLVEKPVRGGRHERLKAAFLIGLAVLVGGAGYYAFSHKGLRMRDIAHSPIQKREDARKKQMALRQKEIRSGICQFNKTGRHKTIDAFVQNWSCLSNDENLASARVLFFGDSHAADKAMGMRQNGVDVVQITGARCSINPALATDQSDFCAELFGLAERNRQSYDAVILSDRFFPGEITASSLRQAFAYWGGGKPVYLFTPMPDFAQQLSEYIKRGTITSPPDFSREDAFLAVVDEIGLPPNIKLVRTSDIWCDRRQPTAERPCAFARDGKFMMTDDGHLTLEGSRIFARNMLADPVLKPLFAQD